MKHDKYINFSIILIVLSVLDIISTQYALATYPALQEGNPIMALVTSSFAIFLLVKAVGILFIINIYKRLRIQSEIASKVGQCIIVIMMILVVGNNVIQIASATTSFGFPSPYELEFPGRVETDGSQSYAYIGHNQYNVTEYFAFGGNDSSGLYYIAANRFYSNGTVRFAVLDWAHPYRMFIVFSNLDVAYTDSFSVNSTDGYYEDNVWPLPGCSNCNDLHKIGTISKINYRMSGFVDSDGNFLIADGLNVIKFVRSADYSKITYITVTPTTDFTPPTNEDVFVDSQITDMALSGSTLHVLVGEHNTAYQLTSTTTVYLSHIVYSGTTKIYSNEVANATTGVSGGSGDGRIVSLIGKILLVDAPSNSSTDVVIGYGQCNLYGQNPPTISMCVSDFSTTVIYLRQYNSTNSSDICPTTCATISGIYGVQAYNGYVYIASAGENKIYRFPTTVTTISGTGYVPGAGTGTTEAPNINYNTKAIASTQAQYYNISQVLISVTIDADSGYNIAGNNYALNYSDNPLAQWFYFDIINPDGVVVGKQGIGHCVDDWDIWNPTGTCSISGLYQFNPPASGWQAGNWYAKLYETSDGGHLALLTTSSTWNVYGDENNTNATTIAPGIEPITSASNQETISLFDNYVGLMGFGINSVSKFLFSLIIIVIMFVVGLWKGSGNIGLALSTIPYTFFSYIEYIPKWVFIIYIIMLISISRVLR